MKKLTALLCLVLALVSLSALAADAETTPTLWPAYDPETGLWGYITEDGAWGIAPQYKSALRFRNGYAIVDMGEDAEGLIDETGAYIFQPVYDLVTWGTIGFDSWVYNDVYQCSPTTRWAGMPRGIRERWATSTVQATPCCPSSTKTQGTSRARWPASALTHPPKAISTARAKLCTGGRRRKEAGKDSEKSAQCCRLTLTNRTKSCIINPKTTCRVPAAADMR